MPSTEIIPSMLSLVLILLNPDMPTAFANSADSDQLTSIDANWSGSALFVIMWICINNLDQVIWLAYH